MPLCNNPRDPRGIRSDFVLTVLDADGSVVCALGPDLGRAAPALDRQQLRATGELVTVPSLDGQTRWRARATAFPDTGQTLVMAVSLAEADATVTRLAQLSALVSALVLVLTALGAWLIARVGLSPLMRIEGTAERIASGDLTQRVPAFREGTEVGRLSVSLNGMLGQIENAFNDRTASESRLRRFVSDASHELRTPIASIRGHAEMGRTGINTDLDTVLSRIESESIRMGDLVDDLLLLARLDQAPRLERSAVDLLSVATDTVVDAKARRPDRSITLTAQPSEVPPVVLGDEGRLRQVLANLVSNALMHTPDNAAVSVGVRVVHVESDAARVEVEVRDTGPGLTPSEVSKVFDRFYRADAGRARGHGGTGLGLAIVRSLAQAHGGAITCASTVGEGTEFILTLPLAGAVSSLVTPTRSVPHGHADVEHDDGREELPGEPDRLQPVSGLADHCHPLRARHRRRHRGRGGGHHGR